MEDIVGRFHSARTARRLVGLACSGLAIALFVPAGSVASLSAAAAATPVPTVSDFQYLGSGQAPPSEADCFSVGRRCFGAAAMQTSYNLGPLYASGNDGHGMTIAIVDSFGDPTIASDVGNVNDQRAL